MEPTRVNTVGELVAILQTLPQDRQLLMWPVTPEAAAEWGLVPVVLVNQDDEPSSPSTACVIFEPATEYMPALLTRDEWFFQGGVQ